MRYIYSNHYKVPEGKRAIELLSGKEGIISQMMPYQHVKAALNLVCYKLFRWSCLLVRWSPSVTTAKNAFTRVASVARLEKDFGKNFVALLSDLIHETFLPVPISIPRRIWTAQEKILPRILCAIMYFIQGLYFSVPITDFIRRKCVWPNV